MSNPQQCLHKAVRENSQIEVESLLNQGVNIDCLFYNWTPLILAVRQGHEKLAILLIEKGCNIHYMDEKGISAFEEAIINNRLEVVKSLIQHGIDVNQSLVTQQSALCYAAEKDNHALAKILINNKADTLQSNRQGETPLHISIRNGSGQMVKLLLDSPQRSQLVDRAVADNTKTTPLILAIINEEDNIAQAIIKINKPTNMKVLILLVACVAYGNAAICEDVCSPLCKTAAGAAGAAVSGGTAAAVAGAAGSVVCSPSCSTLCNWGGKAVDWITGLFGKREINDGWVTVRTWVSVFPRAFASYDTNQDGLISHREFVNAINAEVKDMATLKAFKLADLNDDDYISPAELRVAPFRFSA